MKPNNRNNNIQKQEKIEYTNSFKVNRSSELLEFLLNKMNTSRNNVKSLLSSHQVLVNGHVVSQFNFMLAKDDEVKISKRPIREEKSKSAPAKKQKFYSLNIIYEDDDFIAIDKPSGLLSVESDKEKENCYLYLMQYLQSINPLLRPYQVHRIDKETSGVLIFTKNIKIHSMLKLNWNQYVKTREYCAIIEGRLNDKQGTIESYLLENQNNMVYSSKNPAGKKAITNYKVIKENNEYSMLMVDILTGRKNQIRVHMQDIGHPIIGDDKYGHTKNPIKRLGLHASKLEFEHPITKKLITINAPIPGVFKGLFSK